MSNKVSKDSLIPLVGVELACRRMVQYISAKVFKDGRPKMSEFFGTQEKFNEYFGADADESKRAEAMGRFNDTELQVATFLTQVVRGSHAVHKAGTRQTRLEFTRSNIHDYLFGFTR